MKMNPKQFQVQQIMSEESQTNHSGTTSRPKGSHHLSSNDVGASDPVPQIFVFERDLLMPDGVQLKLQNARMGPIARTSSRQPVLEVVSSLHEGHVRHLYDRQSRVP